jgi:peroxiredoxin/esterase/lipase
MPTPACLLLHGLGGGRHELAPLIEALEACGVPIAAPIFPGHEATNRIMPVSSWQEWSGAAESAFDELAGLNRPIIVIGFSTGATLALHLATRRPVAALILLAPFIAVRHSHLFPIDAATALRYIGRVLPNFPRRRPPVRDRAVRRQLAATIRTRTFNVQATLSALALIERIKPEVPRITVPTLIIDAKLDSVIEPRGVTWLFDHLGSTDKSRVTLSRSDHLVALDHDRVQVLDLITAFIDRVAYNAPAISAEARMTLRKEPHMAQLNVGDKAPDFELTSSTGQTVKLSDYQGKADVVLFFFPKAETPACTMEACSFRDSYQAFQEAGAQVIGISSDSAKTQSRFATRNRLPFTLLADPGGKVRSQFGVTRTLGLFPGRVTFVIDREGIIRHAFSSQFQPWKHVPETLAVLESLKTKRLGLDPAATP